MTTADRYIVNPDPTLTCNPSCSLRYVIVDDYSDWISCREAVDEYRTTHNITTPMVLIPYAKGEIARGVYWIKEPLRSSKTCVGDGLDAQGKMVSQSYIVNTITNLDENVLF